MGKVYCCSDLHGQYGLYKEICDFINPDDIVYCLGDVIDRGPDGWKILTEMYNNPQFIMLKGNHEFMMINGLKEDKQETWNKTIWFNNGGYETYLDCLNSGFPTEWCKAIEELPEIQTYVNAAGQVLYLSHAGFTPRPNEEPQIFDLLWSRDHFTDSWPNDFNNIYIIHGHTPAQYYMPSDTFGIMSKDDIMVYANGHKINLDLMSAFTHQCCLLDLDTFKKHIITEE